MKLESIRRLCLPGTLADSAQKARANGEHGRSVLEYEYALNVQLHALNSAINDHDAGPDVLIPLYTRAIEYAVECGRRQKARHMLRAVMGFPLSPEQHLVIEVLEARLA